MAFRCSRCQISMEHTAYTFAAYQALGRFDIARFTPEGPARIAHDVASPHALTDDFARSRQLPPLTRPARLPRAYSPRLPTSSYASIHRIFHSPSGVYTSNTHNAFHYAPTAWPSFRLFLRRAASCLSRKGAMLQVSSMIFTVAFEGHCCAAAGL